MTDVLNDNFQAPAEDVPGDLLLGETCLWSATLCGGGLHKERGSPLPEGKCLTCCQGLQ